MGNVKAEPLTQGSVILVKVPPEGLPLHPILFYDQVLEKAWREFEEDNDVQFVLVPVKRSEDSSLFLAIELLDFAKQMVDVVLPGEETRAGVPR